MEVIIHKWAAIIYFNFENNIKNVKGEEVYLSMLAVPELQTLQMTNDTTNIYGGWGDNELAFVNNYSLEMGLNLRAVANVHDNSICNLTIK